METVKKYFGLLSYIRNTVIKNSSETATSARVVTAWCLAAVTSIFKIQAQQRKPVKRRPVTMRLLLGALPRSHPVWDWQRRTCQGHSPCDRPRDRGRRRHFEFLRHLGGHRKRGRCGKHCKYIYILYIYYICI